MLIERPLVYCGVKHNWFIGCLKQLHWFSFSKAQNKGLLPNSLNIQLWKQVQKLSYSKWIPAKNVKSPLNRDCATGLSELYEQHNFKRQTENKRKDIKNWGCLQRWAELIINSLKKRCVKSQVWFYQDSLYLKQQGTLQTLFSPENCHMVRQVTLKLAVHVRYLTNELFFVEFLYFWVFSIIGYLQWKIKENMGKRAG